MTRPEAAIPPAGPATRKPSATHPEGGGDRVWLVVLWVAATAYNLFKPFHIDDAAHLLIAQWITQHPLHPMSGLLNWSGVNEPIWHTNQPHLYFYLLAAWGRIAGFSEPAMHALQSLSTLAAILLFHRLARRLAGSLAIWATAVLALGPAFLIEQNLMVDVPLLATWLAFFNLLIGSVRDLNRAGSGQRYLLAGLACSAALLIKYSSLVLLPVLALSLLAERRRPLQWLSLAIPVAALAAWSAFNVYDYGGVHIVARQVQEGGYLRPLMMAVGWMVGLGGLTPLGLIAAVQGRTALARLGSTVYAAVALAISLLTLAVAVGRVSDRLSSHLLWLLFMGNGALTFLALAPGLWRLIPTVPAILGLKPWPRDDAAAAAPGLYLYAWIVVTTVFYVLFTPFLAARHVLLIIPPILLLLAQAWEGRLTLASKAFGLGFVALLSAGLGLSDWRFAAFYRAEAARLAHDLPHTGPSAAWASGHWGWQWYALQAGFPEIDVRATVLRPGDYLLVAPDSANVLERPALLRLVRTDAQGQPLLSLFCTGEPARFYKFNYKSGPWLISRDCLNQLDVYRVVGAPERHRNAALVAQHDALPEDRLKGAGDAAKQTPAKEIIPKP